MKLPARRPAETAGVAGAAGLLIAWALGVDDPGIIVAFGVVVGGIPAIVTGIVELVRRSPQSPPPPA